MIKLLILSAIVVLSAALGVALSANKKKRKTVFSQFYEFNEQLLLNLRYGKNSLYAVAKDYPYVAETINGKIPLDGEDGDIIKSYLKNLGSTDRNSQLEYLTERESVLKKLADESEKDCKKYSSLYLEISLMAGILVAVLLA